MNVTINPDCQRFIDEQVKAGRFGSSAEALEAGIARLMLDPNPDLLDQQDVADVQESLAQIDRGDLIDAATLHAEIRGRFQSR
jgi:Arc/MetJ-type ribon-helix-helix transcriptional regulator